MIRWPAHIEEAASKINLIEEELVEELGREPTEEEAFAVAKARGIKFNENDIRSARKVGVVGTLDYPVGEDDTKGNFIVADGPSVEEIGEQADKKAKVRAMVSMLPLRQKKVIELRFGLVDGIARTLEQVGNHFQVTRERARQIEAKAIENMRSNPIHRRNIIEYCDDINDPQTNPIKPHQVLGLDRSAKSKVRSKRR
ncbi:hypothetical protein A2164_03640 [Candidatus Curtissbacteria bacterium RBG_13_35_7]|uniref:RNA polymerase sigma-70 domain-containing protein n=1 Tax=Candidatus Curtissbacteria bacterium RBG_13_35_7 TaxID=1797705 RepID=A0A1F5G3N2_9BACT|nr:MAG: hypothetical protein A2164_03640 [Candidatus Curtissbacteria bacterium RBG_13_35_7]